MTHQNQEVIRYFEALGYKVSWDAKFRDVEFWHEIFLDGKLICQIDFDIPLEAIIEDFLCFKNGKAGTSSFDYKINGCGAEFDELLAKVATHEERLQKS